jgi:hypothetical protein
MKRLKRALREFWRAWQRGKKPREVHHARVASQVKERNGATRITFESIVLGIDGWTDWSKGK